MWKDDDLMLIVIVISLVILLLITVFAMVLITAQNARLRHKSEKQELQQVLQAEVEKAEKEAVQSTMSEIGRELHDNIGQMLTATQIGLMTHFSDEFENDPTMQEIVELLESSIDEVSLLGRALNTDFWDNKDLFHAIVLASTRLEKLGEVMVLIEQKSDVDGLEKNERIMVFRMFQEIVRNALKHGKANQVNISMQATPFEIIIQDNGLGFDPSKNVNGSGITNILHRAKLIDFSAIVSSTIGNGTTWKLTKK